MSTEQKHVPNDQEIDLSQLWKRMGNAYQGFLSRIYKSIVFVVKNIVIISILFIIGLGLGIYLDATSKNYEHEIIVSPNFGSTDYLYSKVKLINSKIKEKDTAFLNSIGLKSSDEIVKIEIEPIVDVYNFVNLNASDVSNAQNTQNFELLKLMAESGDINKVIEKDVTSKNYPNHKIILLSSKPVDSKKTIDPILAYLNSNPYFQTMQVIHIGNIKSKIIKSEEIIGQINNILDDFSSETLKNQKSDKLVYYNENTQLNDIIKTKDRLIAEVAMQRIELITYDQIIKEKSRTYNNLLTNGLNGRMKLALPVLILLIFFMYIGFSGFYKNQASKHNNNL